MKFETYVILGILTAALVIPIALLSMYNIWFGLLFIPLVIWMFILKSKQP